MKKLLAVSKPLRYTGGEYGMIKKDPAGKLKFCLTFPDIYEIGMSHLGFKILYSALNSSEKICCERFFAPWPDAWEKLGKNVMVSLENRLPIRSFDVLGFSMQYELAYTTALQLLKMGGIPLKSSGRGDSDPIVVAGGGCILNPAPLKDFIDVFFMGEMDEALVPTMESLQSLIAKGATRKQKLELLNSYPFAYVPSVEPDKKVKREIFKDFSSTSILPAPMVPIMPVIQDRIAMEIARGCTNGCRFCQAGMIYRPVREKGVTSLCSGALELLNNTGYREVSLLSLDTGDYSEINGLLKTMNVLLSPKNIAMSLPSLRAETVSAELLDAVSDARRSGFTIAPEAGTQRLRNIINKNLTEDEIINAAIYAKNAGFSGAKLYFMCGLPYETDEDITAIAELAGKIRSAVKGGRFDVTVSLSNFVPKPHTPFERFPQISVDEMKYKHMLLKDALKRYKIKLRYHDSFTSSIEAAIARGDEKWGELFTDAVEKGFYLDAWSEFFSIDKWQALFEDRGVSAGDFAGRAYADDELLPWRMVDNGVSPKWLLKERDAAKNAATTPDCRTGTCSGCGVCRDDIKNVRAPQETPPAYNKADNTVNKTTADTGDNGKQTDDITSYTQTSAKEPLYAKYELIYEKTGVSSFMSALDLSRIFSHMFLSTGVRLKFTQGFHPQPRLVIQSPTPVGVQGLNESLLFEADLADELSDNLKSELNKRAPGGLYIKAINKTTWPDNLAEYEMTMRLDDKSFAHLANCVKNSTAGYEKLDKKGRPKIVDISDFLLGIDDKKHTVRLKTGSSGGFHLPEFFKKSGFKGQPEITRVELTAVFHAIKQTN